MGVKGTASRHMSMSEIARLVMKMLVMVCMALFLSTMKTTRALPDTPTMKMMEYMRTKRTISQVRRITWSWSRWGTCSGLNVVLSCACTAADGLVFSANSTTATKLPDVVMVFTQVDKTERSNDNRKSQTAITNILP